MATQDIFAKRFREIFRRMKVTQRKSLDDTALHDFFNNSYQNSREMPRPTHYDHSPIKRPAITANLGADITNFISMELPDFIGSVSSEAPSVIRDDIEPGWYREIDTKDELMLSNYSLSGIANSSKVVRTWIYYTKYPFDQVFDIRYFDGRPSEIDIFDRRKDCVTIDYKQGWFNKVVIYGNKHISELFFDNIGLTEIRRCRDHRSPIMIIYTSPSGTPTGWAKCRHYEFEFLGNHEFCEITGKLKKNFSQATPDGNFYVVLPRRDDNVLKYFEGQIELVAVPFQTRWPGDGHEDLTEIPIHQFFELVDDKKHGLEMIYVIPSNVLDDPQLNYRADIIVKSIEQIKSETITYDGSVLKALSNDKRKNYITRYFFNGKVVPDDYFDRINKVVIDVISGSVMINGMTADIIGNIINDYMSDKSIINDIPLDDSIIDNINSYLLPRSDHIIFNKPK